MLKMRSFVVYARTLIAHCYISDRIKRLRLRNGTYLTVTSNVDRNPRDFEEGVRLLTKAHICAELDILGTVSR